MNRTQKIMRNGAVNLIGQVLTILLGFISRKVFLQYIGVEMLGLNSTFASILNTISLAELGFQQVIVFHLYGVLARDDKEQINALVNVYKLVYRCIGIFFIVASLCCLPFLQYFLSDIEASNTVRVFFLIQALTGACSYFLSYKRNLLYADQRSYIAGLIDMVIHTAATILSILAAVLTHSYLLYLLIWLARTYLSNIIVHVASTRMYPYLHAAKFDWKLTKQLATDLKDIVVERIAFYIYGSTDNLLISAFISTVQVGFLNNYIMVTGNVKALVKSLTTPLIPAIGNLVATSKNHKQQMESFRTLVQAYFWLAGIALVPVYVLADSFIQLYIGEQFILPKILLFWLCVDLYTHIMQDVCLSFLTANGMFQMRRNISIGGAITNIIVSLLLMKPFGIAGILAGTAVSQVYYWVARSVAAFRECLKQSWRTFALYWLKQLGLLVVIVAAIWLSSLMTRRIFVVNGVLTFIVNGVICEVCFVILAFLCCRGSKAQRSLEGIVLGILRKRLRKET